MGVRSYNLIAEAMALDGSLVEVQAFLAEAMIYDASQRIGIKVEEVISTGPMIDRCGTLATGADGQEANPVAGIEVVQSPRVCETAVTNRNDHHSQVAEEDRTRVVGRRRDPVVASPFLGRVVMLLQTATPSVSSGAPLTMKR